MGPKVLQFETTLELHVLLAWVQISMFLNGEHTESSMGPLTGAYIKPFLVECTANTSRSWEEHKNRFTRTRVLKITCLQVRVTLDNRPP